MWAFFSRLHHIGLSKHLHGTKVLVLIDLNIRVLNNHTGHLIRQLTLDPTRGVKCGKSPENQVDM